MRSRLIAGCAVAALGLGVQAAGAAAAKPVLWVKNIAEERVAPGAAANLRTAFDESCEIHQPAHLQTNGKPSDKLTVGPAAGGMECEGEKVSGSLTAVALTPAGPSGSSAMTITVKDTVHLLFPGQWCVYTLPKKLTLPESAESQSSAIVTSTLDKSASFGTCASNHQDEVSIEVEDPETLSPFFAEVL